ncbi:centrosome and spindle pole-associated protein 1 isoform X1 [Cynoglossus semilaevis]|uniref:centrosome and spindle pole-associated protein 1 isoform X1 n=1 Tax=Cynoglossus semilaevis TaxID=244447 RepID=UPI000D626118|nr:centrosome and spindle pole-associated protein 1 isoform X1 [Cynoglossus semilaevis]XP_024910418.1 centrosome and spindle pole-associated protein 1 isoform X1 [Cynoglossus semilaevis]
MPPASAVHRVNPDTNTGLGLTLMLGTEYEKKKQKLLQELQLDYKHYISQKSHVKVSKRLSQTPSVSLPIDEHLSAKEKLREERKREYNTFLQDKAQINRSKKKTALSTAKPEQGQSTDTEHVSSRPAALLVLKTQTKTSTPQTKRPLSRRDAATLTEAVEKTTNRRTWDRSERRRKRWLLYRPVELHSSEEELFRDEEEEGEIDLGPRRKNADSPESEERRGRESRDKSRAPRKVKEIETSGGQDQKIIDFYVKPDLQKPDGSRVSAVINDRAEFATGLLIGSAEEQSSTQLRKEQYKQELLKQMEEEQRNRMREKKLELRVAATGATDPEKKPDRIKQFRVIHPTGHNAHLLGKQQQVIVREGDLRPKDQRSGENTEKRRLPEVFQVNTVTRSGTEEKPGLDYLQEDYHRDITQMLREVAIPRAADVPPPPSVPTVSKNYTTPYDAAYYYYGARNPLDPSRQQYQSDLSGLVQQSVSLQSSPEKPPPPRPQPTEPQAASPPVLVGELSVDESKRRRESALNYQEALKQQIKEREEQRKREKEEKERYDARMEAEMTVYNPWGRSGGGAPIKDQKGNLFSDLNQMHRINEETYKNPDFKNDEQRQSSNGEFSAVEVKASYSHPLPDFTNPQGPQQLHMQNRYKEELKQQIEANKRKQVEERERIRVEEEKEEKRLAAQRMRIQWEYEEEQRRQKMIEIKLDNHSWINAPKMGHQKEEKEEEEEQVQETKKMATESRCNSDENKLPVMFERQPSPPVPAVLKRRTNLVPSRPASSVSHLSSRTSSQRSVSAPHHPSVPAGTSQLTDGNHEVIRQLSALRRVLKKEQKNLEGQMVKRDGQERLQTPPHRPRRRHMEESSQREAKQPSTAQTYSVPARVHIENIREFNRLKYRESSSREEVIQMFPDPPIDDQSLDIQQQALLREQRRKLRVMKREEDEDLLDLQLSYYYPKRKAEDLVHRGSVLPSETTFMDVYSGSDFEEKHQRQRSPPPPAEHPESTSTWRRRDSDV